MNRIALKNERNTEGLMRCTVHLASTANVQENGHLPAGAMPVSGSEPGPLGVLQNDEI